MCGIKINYIPFCLCNVSSEGKRGNYSERLLREPFDLCVSKFIFPADFPEKKSLPNQEVLPVY